MIPLVTVEEYAVKFYVTVAKKIKKYIRECEILIVFLICGPRIFHLCKHSISRSEVGDLLVDFRNAVAVNCDAAYEDVAVVGNARLVSKEREVLVREEAGHG